MSNKETGLMRKTKKELVDIILRKDDVESNLKERLENTANKYAELASKNDALNKSYATLSDEIGKLKKYLNEANRNVEQHQSGIDEVTTQKAEVEAVANSLKKNIKKMKALNWVLFICAIILAVCLIVVI